MACQQITEEDDSMELAGIDEGNIQSGEDPQLDISNVPGPDLELHMTVKDSEHTAVCIKELKPQALDFEGANLCKQEN